MSRKPIFAAAAAVIALGILAGCEDQEDQTAVAGQAVTEESHSHEDSAAVDLGGMPKLFDDDRILGDPNAPVTIVEYSSLTCPHCASFHRDTLPELKKQYIDTGKVRLVYRDFPFDRLGATAAMLARCVDEPRFFKFVDALFAKQEEWSRAQDPFSALAAIGKLGGIGQQQFNACMENEAQLDTILERRLEGEQTFQVQATPTFLINGTKVEGAQSFESFKDVIESKLN